MQKKLGLIERRGISTQSHRRDGALVATEPKNYGFYLIETSDLRHSADVVKPGHRKGRLTSGMCPDLLRGFGCHELPSWVTFGRYRWQAGMSGLPRSRPCPLAERTTGCRQ
jgi:hypothetical protein